MSVTRCTARANGSLFVGIGSPHGDDRLGWEVADRLSQNADLRGEFSFRQASIPTDLLDWLDGVACLHFCDACRTSSPPGALHRWEWDRSHLTPQDRTLPAFSAGLRSAGTHAWGLMDVLSLANELARLPERVTIWGIEGLRFEPGQPMSPETIERLPGIVDTITESLTR